MQLYLETPGCLPNSYFSCWSYAITRQRELPSASLWGWELTSCHNSVTWVISAVASQGGTGSKLEAGTGAGHRTQALQHGMCGLTTKLCILEMTDRGEPNLLILDVTQSHLESVEISGWS